MAHEGEATAGIDGYLFRLIATFEAAAMQQLGKIAHPLTGDVDVDLDGARDSIEMLDMVRRKTEGNLNADERRLLEHVLYQLRMNYVDVSREGSAPGAADREAGAGTEAAPDGADGAADGGEQSAGESSSGGEEGGSA